METRLISSRSDRLHILETTIDENLLAFVLVGTCLSEIRDQALYQGEINPDTGELYQGWMEYLRSRWMGKISHLYQCMDATVIRAYLRENSAMAEFLPSYERPIRPLTKLATPKQVTLGKADPNLWVLAWERAIDRAGGTEPTQTHTKWAVDQLLKVRKHADLPAPEPWTGKWERNHIYQANVATREFVTSLPEGTVDFFITDPPYFPDPDGGYLLYETAGAIARRVLKPGGYAAIYLGKLDLPILLGILGGHLDYEWTYAIYRPAGQWPFRKVQFKECWRPIGIFRQPGERFETIYIPDASEGAYEKDTHEWQQEIQPVRALIQKYTSPGQLVLDPFVGGGTKPLAAYLLGRDYLGFDEDPMAVATALQRISDVQESERETELHDV